MSKTCSTSPKILFENSWRKEITEEPDNSGLPGKFAIKLVFLVCVCSCYSEYFIFNIIAVSDYPHQLLLGCITAVARCLLPQAEWRDLVCVSVCLSVGHVCEPCKNG